MDALTFLADVWELQLDRRDKKQYGFLAYRDDDGWWCDHIVPLKDGLPTDLPNDGKNLYFCPNLFTKGKRRAETVTPSCWLYADLDEVKPSQCANLGVTPTIAWETSPGRYQCLWEVSRLLPPEIHSKLNQRMTYFTGADKGGWGLSKVLRLPGTESLKYKKPFLVSVTWGDGPTYGVKTLTKLLRDVEVSGNGLVMPKDFVLPEMTKSTVMRKYELTGKAKRLLMAKSATGDRSARLWQLEGSLLEAGVKPEEVLVAVRDTVWNKYAGQRREIPALWREISKHVDQLDKGGSTKDPRKRKKKRHAMNGDLVALDDFLMQDVQEIGWLVDNIWSDKAHGIIAGEAKTYKSTLALDLAVSVASGTKFLGHFEVPKKGPVVYINSENPRWMMKDRLVRIAGSRGLLPGGTVRGDEITIGRSQLPIYIKNDFGFDLTETDHLNYLAEIAQTLKPELIVLDPWYKMTPDINENVAAEVNPILQNLMQIKDQFNVGIIIIHHYKKQSAQAPVAGGARISGTSLFHRWLESAVYVERGDKMGQVRIGTEQRMGLPIDSIELEFSMRDEEDYWVEVDVPKQDTGNSLVEEILAYVAEEELTIAQLAKATGVSADRVKRLVRTTDELKMGLAKSSGARGRPSATVRLAK